MTGASKKIDLVEERILVGKRLRSTDAVRVHTLVHVDEESIQVPVASETIEVARVEIDRWVDGPVPERLEGDTRIITLHIEVPVTVTRLKAIEEIRITRRRDVAIATEQVTVRREEAIVERFPAPTADAGEHGPAADAGSRIDTHPTTKHGA